MTDDCTRTVDSSWSESPRLIITAISGKLMGFVPQSYTAGKNGSKTWTFHTICQFLMWRTSIHSEEDVVL